MAGHPGQGARIQLLARGPQDATTSAPWTPAPAGRPKAHSTLWGDPWARYQSVTRRHTPFSVDCVDVHFARPFAPGTTNVLDIPCTLGDLLGDLFLRVELPAMGEGARWVPRVGRALLRRVRLYVGEALVQDQERLWMGLWDRLFCPAERRAGLDALLGREDASEAQTLTIPLQLLCCKSHRTVRSWFPAAALPGSHMAIHFDTETLAACLASGDASAAPRALEATVLADVVSLMPEEARMFLSSPPLLTYDSVQDVEATNRSQDAVGEVAVPVVTVTFSELTRPVRYFAWVAYRPGLEDGMFEYVPVRDATLYVGQAELRGQRPGDHYARDHRYGVEGASCDASEDVGTLFFALRPADFAPTGSASFAHSDPPRLRVSVPSDQELVVKLFAVCHAFVRVDKGRARVLFS